MRIIAIALAALAALAAAPVASAADMAGTDIIGTDGAVIGKATFEQTPTGVLMSVDVAACRPAVMASTCMPSARARRTSRPPPATSIRARSSTACAIPRGPDNGDLPNLFAAADGSAGAEFFTTRVSVAAAKCPPFSTTMARRSSFTRTPMITWPSPSAAQADASAAASSERCSRAVSRTTPFGGRRRPCRRTGLLPGGGSSQPREGRRVRAAAPARSTPRARPGPG